MILNIMNRHLNDSYQVKSYTKKAFKVFLLSCLRPELIEKNKTPIQKISEAHCKRQANLDPSVQKTILGAAPLVRPGESEFPDLNHMQIYNYQGKTMTYHDDDRRPQSSKH